MSSGLNQAPPVLLNLESVTDPNLRFNFDAVNRALARVQQIQQPPAANIVFGPILDSKTLTYAAGAIQVVANLNVQINTRGNPVMIAVTAGQFSSALTYWSNVELLSITDSFTGSAIGYYRTDSSGNRVQLSLQSFNFQAGGALNLKDSFHMPCFAFYDNSVSTGSWMYQLYVIMTQATSKLSLSNVRLMAQELR